MKKTQKVNISGIVFNIDEDAYLQLDNYLSQISNRFANLDEAKEIVNDIEQRIAELFHEKGKSGEYVVTIDDVKEVIGVLGSPSDYSDTDAPQFEYTRKKRMYRDADNSIIAGIGSGLGNYFNIDISIVRLILIILCFVSFGTFLFVYLLLWLIIPPAITPTQKLEMQGKEFNIGSIQEKISSKKAHVNSDSWADRLVNALGKIVSVFGKIIYVFLRVILIIIGVAFIIAGVSFVAALLIGVFHGSAIFNANGIPVIGSISTEIISHFTSVSMFYTLLITLFLVVIIPCLLFVYLGLRMIFHFKSADKALLLSSFAIWFASAIVLGISAGFIAKDFNKTQRIAQVTEFLPEQQKVNIVALNSDHFTKINKNSSLVIGDAAIYTSTDGEELYFEPEIKIRKGDSDKIKVEVIIRANGATRLEASNNIRDIKYNYKIKGDTLFLDQLFTLKNNSKFRAQQVDVYVYIPTGKGVSLNSEAYNFLDHSWACSDIYMNNKYDVVNVMGKNELNEDED